MNFTVDLERLVAGGDSLEDIMELYVRPAIETEYRKVQADLSFYKRVQEARDAVARGDFTGEQLLTLNADLAKRTAKPTFKERPGRVMSSDEVNSILLALQG